MSAATAIENGRRVTFEHPSAVGLAALVEYEGKRRLAYASTGKPAPIVGHEVELEGAKFIVRSVDVSRKPPTITLGLAAVGEEPAGDA